MELRGYWSPSAGEYCKQSGGTHLPSSPNGMGTGLLSRPESVRARPTAPSRRDLGNKL